MAGVASGDFLAPAAPVRRWSPRQSPLHDVVATVWTHVVPAGVTSLRVVPDAAVDIVVRDGQARVAGPDTTAVVEELVPGGRVIGFQVRPGAVHGLLGVPASALRDQRVDLAELWGPAAGPVEEAAASGDPLAIASALAVGARTVGLDPLAGVVLRRVRAGAPVASLADDLGIGERQLRRRCTAAFGYGPKFLARVVRFQGVVDRLRAAPTTPLARLAVEAGYADQAHLSHEVGALCGVPPGRLRDGLLMSDPDKTPVD